MKTIETHAGGVAISNKSYVVTCPHDHETLKIGDVVVMVETPAPTLDMFLLRVTDRTLHRLRDKCDQYVHLAEILKED